LIIIILPVKSSRTTARGVTSAALGSRFAARYKDSFSLGKLAGKLVDEVRSIPPSSKFFDLLFDRRHLAVFLDLPLHMAYWLCGVGMRRG
jgi:hypothetical protein